MAADDDIAAMRRSYEAGTLDEVDLGPTWLEQLRVWLDEAVAAGLTEPNAMVLATAADDGKPSARTVLLKGLDDHGLTFFTNLRSRKGSELAENAHATAVLPWIDIQRQVIVEGTVATVPSEEADAYFASRPRGSQLAALASPQSAIVASREELDSRYTEVADTHSGDGPIPRPEHWGGLRIAPESVEFWQGRADRLHDRLRFRHHDGEWRVERLAP